MWYSVRVQLIDLTGQRFGHQVALRRGPDYRRGYPRWWVQCDCGSAERLIIGHQLRAGLSRSCGCGLTHNGQKRRKKPRIDMQGRVYGEWTALEYAGASKWLCRCSCGFESEVYGWSLRRGDTKSCGHVFGRDRKPRPRRAPNSTPEGRKQQSRKNRKEKARYVENYKMERGCRDCGLQPKYPTMLSYDHLPQYKKLFDLSKATSYGWKKIHAEIAKCEIVCLNCHAIRTAARLAP